MKTLFFSVIGLVLGANIALAKNSELRCGFNGSDTVAPNGSVLAHSINPMIVKKALNLQVTYYDRSISLMNPMDFSMYPLVAFYNCQVPSPANMLCYTYQNYNNPIPQAPRYFNVFVSQSFSDAEGLGQMILSAPTMGPSGAQVHDNYTCKLLDK